MTDLEDRLPALLDVIAQEAPTTTGLADAARRRHRLRRRRRIAAGSMVAVGVIALTSVVVVEDDSRSTEVAHDPASVADGAWQSISDGKAVAEVPTGWKPHDCTPGTVMGELRWAPTRTGCEQMRGASFTIAANTDFIMGPGELVRGDGVWTGFVYDSFESLYVADPSADVVRRALASLHVKGQPVVHARRWVARERDGLRYQVPLWWGLGQRGDQADYSVCAVPAPTGEDNGQRGSTSYVRTESFEGVAVRVTAPTEPLADMVMATVDVDPDAAPAARCAPEDFRGAATSTPDTGYKVVERAGVRMEVPWNWRGMDCEMPVVVPLQDCPTDPRSAGARLYPEALYDPVRGPREVVRSEEDDEVQWSGYVISGQYAVTVAHADRATVEHILASVEP